MGLYKKLKVYEFKTLRTIIRSLNEIIVGLKYF